LSQKYWSGLPFMSLRKGKAVDTEVCVKNVCRDCLPSSHYTKKDIKTIKSWCTTATNEKQLRYRLTLMLNNIDVKVLQTIMEQVPSKLRLKKKILWRRINFFFNNKCLFISIKFTFYVIKTKSHTICTCVGFYIN
jgi:hypothetical protein